MTKYLAAVMITSVVGLVVLVVAAMSLGYDSELASKGIWALSSIFSGSVGIGGTYLVMRKRRR